MEDAPGARARPFQHVISPLAKSSGFAASFAFFVDKRVKRRTLHFCTPTCGRQFSRGRIKSDRAKPAVASATYENLPLTPEGPAVGWLAYSRASLGAA
jgi:hypothetical protein